MRLCELCGSSLFGMRTCLRACLFACLPHLGCLPNIQSFQSLGSSIPRFFNPSVLQFSSSPVLQFFSSSTLLRPTPRSKDMKVARPKPKTQNPTGEKSGASLLLAPNLESRIQMGQSDSRSWRRGLDRICELDKPRVSRARRQVRASESERSIILLDFP